MWAAQGMLIVKQKELEEKIKKEEEANNRDPYDFEVSGPCNLSPSTWQEIVRHPWKDDNYKRTVMACFINAAYLLELDRQEKREWDAALAPKWCKPFNYKIVEVLVDERDGAIFGATLEWDNMVAAVSGLVEKKPSKAPKAVIALRGTLLTVATIINDIDEDLRIFFTNDLSGSSRFRRTLEAVSTAVGKYGSSEVCLAGHSLGASLAMQVGMALTLEGIIVEAHLFNPPSLSLPSIFGGIVEKLEMICDDVKGRIRAIIPSAKNPNNDSYKQSDHEGEIQKWVAHLYVNVGDYICAYYADGFEKLKNCVTDKNKLMERNMPAEALGMKRVVAKLNIISDSSMKVMEAHSIRQWWSCESEVPIVLNGSRLIEKQLNSLMQRSHVKTLDSWPIISTNLLSELCLTYD